MLCRPKYLEKRKHYFYESRIHFHLFSNDKRDSVALKESGVRLKYPVYIIIRIDRISQSPNYKWN
uniref:Uncharacterized protein n=1 Tax=Lepeophtheirus salmonis TaxID=72036 RepID=A0A0K2UV94_LEPSM